jgi:leucyl aminopeptidase
MKKMMVIKTRIRKADPSVVKTDLLALGITAGPRSLTKAARALDRATGGRIAGIVKLGDFTGKKGTTRLLDAPEGLGASRLLLVGLGDTETLCLDRLRKAAERAAATALRLKLRTLSLSLHNDLSRRLDRVEVARALVEGAYFGAYRYDEFRTGDPDARAERLTLEIVEANTDQAAPLRRGLAIGTCIGTANQWARNIANRPGNVINPPALAREARSLARRSPRLSCTVWDKKQLIAKGMGGVLAVGAGSASDPRFIVLRHRALTRAGARRPTVALVGKAITFDSGGISIKPSAEMDQMKFDKTGGVAVLATLGAVADLKLDLNVIGVVPSAENLPSASSYRPGDIVTTYSGKTVEILNTDAEGRMILCDGIAWASEQKADIIIDIATLTGACMVALGKHQAGLFSNDDTVLEDLKRASDLSGEKVWHLPCCDVYANDMESKRADLKNCGPRWGGASTAAAFLRQFVGDARWAHLDIAGVDVINPPGSPNGNVSSGFGVRLLTTYLRNLAVT